MLFRVILLLFCLSCFSCKTEDNTKGEEKIEPLLFKNLPSTTSGITFQNALIEDDTLNILDYLYFYNGGGTAVGDINNDGLPDIYLAGNQQKNKLYLNKGNLKFQDITDSAQVNGNSDWNTGTILFDANQDGFLDIYVRAVVGINGFAGHDELFINNGDLTFTERSNEYNLAYQCYGTSAALLDYDRDGDLDIYQLNHAVHTQESFGKASLRLDRNNNTGDRLLRNDNGTFTDVSDQAGIYGGINGYGLGVSIADFNQDGWPDIYVGNDFHEDDYYYINLGDGSFRESLKDHFGHTSRFSMGNDVTDINQDGFPDLISLDMLPQDERVLKSSEGDDNIQTQKLRTERFGYHYQFTRNMLFINQPNYQFKEQALSSGIAATDWSWSALFADYDQDGIQDLFISNGIPKRPNNLDFINFLSNKEIQNRVNKTRLIDNKALELMPDGNTQNIVFKGMKNLNFKNKTTNWLPQQATISGATSLADLDNDGDLDLVVNNINTEVGIYINQSDSTSNSLRIKLNYIPKNKDGIGTKVYAYTNGDMQYKELYTARGFQASSQAIIHFGFGTIPIVDSLKIVWPDDTFQVMNSVSTNQKLIISPENTKTFDYDSFFTKPTPLFAKVENNLGIDYTHKEDSYIDFNRQKLIPYQVSDRGPAVAIGDINGDGNEDIYFGSSRFESSQVFYGDDHSAFAKAHTETLSDIAKTEDITATIIDQQVIIGTAGANFSNNSPALQDYSLIAENKTHLDINGNTSIITKSDIDNDGDLDLFVGMHVITGDFGKSPSSYILKNVNGVFSKDPDNDLGEIGMVTDALWTDFTGDKIDDLIVIGEWMEPVFYENRNGKLKKLSLLTENLSGLWQSIEPFDVDQDGDVDYLLGNWGTNSKFTASSEEPMLMYRTDFDKNGQTETIVTTASKGNYYPTQNLTELASQLVFLKKKYRTNNAFAGQTISNIFGDDVLETSHKLSVTTLTSGYLKNNKGQFTFVSFPTQLQVAPIMDFVTYDFTGDGKLDVLAGGNYFGTKPYHGRLDSFSGALIESDTNITPGYKTGLDIAQKSVRHLDIITLNNRAYLLATFNNEKAQVYSIEKQ